jgi:hypothetical protein
MIIHSKKTKEEEVQSMHRRQRLAKNGYCTSHHNLFSHTYLLLMHQFQPTQTILNAQEMSNHSFFSGTNDLLSKLNGGKSPIAEALS